MATKNLFYWGFWLGFLPVLPYNGGAVCAEQGFPSYAAAPNANQILLLISCFFVLALANVDR